jgi:hypothetical protein
MQTQNADPTKDRGDYAHDFDESGLIPCRMFEASIMGMNKVRRFQKVINEIVEYHVPLNFLLLRKKIRNKKKPFQEEGFACPVGKETIVYL